MAERIKGTGQLRREYKALLEKTGGHDVVTRAGLKRLDEQRKAYLLERAADRQRLLIEKLAVTVALQASDADEAKPDGQ